MDREWKCELQIAKGAAASLPPAMIGETGWDILLALSGQGPSGVTVERLGPMVSVSRAALCEWLDWLEDRRLVATGWHTFTDQLGAAITRAGNELVHNVLMAASSLQGPTHH